MLRKGEAAGGAGEAGGGGGQAGSPGRAAPVGRVVPVDRAAPGARRPAARPAAAVVRTTVDPVDPGEPVGRGEPVETRRSTAGQRPAPPGSRTVTATRRGLPGRPDDPA